MSNPPEIKVSGAPATRHSFEIELHEVARSFEGKQNTARTRDEMYLALSGVLAKWKDSWPSDMPEMFFVIDADSTARNIHAVLVAFKSAEKRIEHEDCSYCEYLGSTQNYDHYYCTQRTLGMPTVIARFGVGPRYVSGLELAKIGSLDQLRQPEERALRVSYLLARQKGLVT